MTIISIMFFVDDDTTFRMTVSWGELFDKMIETLGKRRCGPWSTIQRRRRRTKEMCKIKNGNYDKIIAVWYKSVLVVDQWSMIIHVHCLFDNSCHLPGASCPRCTDTNLSIVMIDCYHLGVDFVLNNMTQFLFYNWRAVCQAIALGLRWNHRFNP